LSLLLRFSAYCVLISHFHHACYMPTNFIYLYIIAVLLLTEVYKILNVSLAIFAIEKLLYFVYFFKI
jgi:hypothetical protein